MYCNAENKTGVSSVKIFSVRCMSRMYKGHTQKVMCKSLFYDNEVSVAKEVREEFRAGGFVEFTARSNSVSTANLPSSILTLGFPSLCCSDGE